jgi:hypothetical protein
MSSQPPKCRQEQATLGTPSFVVFAFNLLIVGGFVALANLFRIGDFPLGYFVAVLHRVLFGLFPGSDSFGIPHGGKLPLSPISHHQQWILFNQCLWHDCDGRNWTLHLSTVLVARLANRKTTGLEANPDAGGR